jgi:16S rRNA (cytidine1402-2'-O)-methyltransferase
MHEEARRGDLPALATAYAAEPEPRGEIVIVIAPPGEAAAASAADVETLLRQALARGSVKSAVAEVSAVTGEPRSEVYRRALAMTQGSGDGTQD